MPSDMAVLLADHMYMGRCSGLVMPARHEAEYPNSCRAVVNTLARPICISAWWSTVRQELCVLLPTKGIGLFCEW